MNPLRRLGDASHHKPDSFAVSLMALATPVVRLRSTYLEHLFKLGTDIENV